MTYLRTVDILPLYTDEQIGASIETLVQQKMDLTRKLLQLTTQLLLVARKLPEEREALRRLCAETHEWMDNGCPPLPVPLT